MSRIAHLSDLHFGAPDRLQHNIHDGLVRALQAGPKVDLMVLTGDVFESNQPDAAMLEGFLGLFERIEAVLGDVPALIIPGNHDRRGDGVFGPWTEDLFRELRQRLSSRPKVRVLGTSTPFLAEMVDLPGFPADIVAYDSSFLPRGLISAGGVVRQEDLLQIAATLLDRDPERPLLFLLHHHLVPTPVTDTSVIHTKGRPVWQRFLVSRLLPDLVGQGDREELTMTALGAGTALTTLQTLGRAVVVLHGHKHYPTARLLKGIGADADLLVTSAGSCGKAQDWSGGDFDEAPKLWPSINYIELTSEHVEVTSQAWSPWEPSRRNHPRTVASASRKGVRWEVRHEAMGRPASETVLAHNEAEFHLATSGNALDRHDLEVRRSVKALPAAYMTEYWDVVEGPPGARVVNIRSAGHVREEEVCPARVKLPMDGTPATFRVRDGVFGSVNAAEEVRGAGSCFGWVGLLNRSRAATAKLTLHLGPVTSEPFASATDLTTGKERPMRFLRDGNAVSLRYDDCPARTLLRIYWPLAT